MPAQERCSRGPLVYSKLAAPKPSVVYDTYWRFACERQNIFWRRLEKGPQPWTTDPILQRHRFTNAYRASDRVSQYLIRRVIYDRQRSPEDTLFRLLLFKFLNKIETWELLQREIGELAWESYSYAKYDRVLTHAINAGTRIYSAAYIMPACLALGAGRKHSGHLRLIEKMLSEDVAPTD